MRKLLRISAVATVVIALGIVWALAQGNLDKHGLSTDPSSPIRICTVNSKCPLQKMEIPTIDPRKEDVSSIDGMVKAWYDIVNVPKGSQPDWARDHTLYTPETRFLSIDVDKNGGARATILDHTMYASGVGPQVETKGFYEVEIHRVTQRFGQTAHVMSTYETRRSKDSPVIARGINSIELFNDGSRWWISYAQWDEERPGNPLPKEFLP